MFKKKIYDLCFIIVLICAIYINVEKIKSGFVEKTEKSEVTIDKEADEYKGEEVVEKNQSTIVGDKYEYRREEITEADQDKLEKVSDIPNHMTPFCDFEEIEKNHKILEYDICSNPKYDYENIPLGEYLSTEIAEVKETLGEVVASRTTIDYHVFDFNDDGLEDYLICIDGLLHSGSGGNHVEIDVQEEDGTFRKVLDIVMRLHGDDPDGHEALTVLDEKTDGYYAIVTPFYNHILRYDKETGWYEFHDGE